MKFIIFAAVVAVCAAAPAPFGFLGAHPLTYSAPVAVVPQVANHVIQPQFSGSVVSSGVFPTTYTGATGGFQQGQFFGGLPGTFVRNSGAAIAPIVAPQPIAYSAPKTSAITYTSQPNAFTYSAQPSALTYSAVQHPSALTYSAVQHPSALTYSAVQQPSALTYSGSVVAPLVGQFPKTVQQNEGASLVTY